MAERGPRAALRAMARPFPRWGTFSRHKSNGRLPSGRDLRTTAGRPAAGGSGESGGALSVTSL